MTSNPEYGTRTLRPEPKPENRGQIITAIGIPVLSLYDYHNVIAPAPNHPYLTNSVLYI